MLREAATVNGFTALAVNKLDVLSGSGELQIATAYRIDGKLRHEFPMTLRRARARRAGLREPPGLERGPARLRRFEDLPAARARYVERVEALVGVPVELISVGPEPRRDDRAPGSLPAGLTLAAVDTHPGRVVPTARAASSVGRAPGF